jgi:hypothetical protein
MTPPYVFYTKSGGGGVYFPHTNSVRVNLNVNLQSHINSVSVKLTDYLRLT